ncbi:protein dispatched homolog 3 isoform X1 [Nematostella vectensis]|uniref:protein dispatched homolog 3 isoform X1 n=1 Tax=Nematostella vectensis TaxID=45351 RepID=UPI00138FED29|nr:protein dispatched homolog 3 isoform X1 [Nematostella vectensis]
MVKNFILLFSAACDFSMTVVYSCCFVFKGFLLGAHLVLIITTAALYFSGYDILPADFTQVPLNLETDERKLRADAWKFARQDSLVTLNPIIVGDQSERSVRRDALEIVYETRDGNVFSRRNLKVIEKTEKEIFNNKIYRDHLCLLAGKTKCQAPLSIIRFFDGSLKSIHPDLYDPEFRRIPKVLARASRINFTRAMLTFHLAKDAVISLKQNKASSHYTRSLFYIGAPLKGFLNAEDRPDEQWEKNQEYAKSAFADQLEKKYKDGLGSMRMYYFLIALFFNSISQQVIYDLLLAGASFTFIFLFMLFQTQSIWITSWAVFSILSCFFGANFVYRMILDCRYIGIFHVLSVFIILGIGADDVFVFLDTWRGSDQRAFPNLAAKLSFVYRRAASAMFITSVTTMVAFTTSVFSPLLGVSTFGIFSALLVFVNYCSVITFFPTVVITYELYWKNWNWNCFSSLGWTEAQTRENEFVEEREVEMSWQEKFQQPHKLIVRFFGGLFYTKVIGHKIFRWVIIGFFAGVISVSVFFAVQLQPDEEQVAVWGKGTNWYSIKQLRKLAFRPSQEDKVVIVNLIWGLQPQDRRSCHFTDYKCKGKTVFDHSFDMNPPPCQMAMLEFCHELKTLPQSVVDKLRIRRSAVTGEIEVHCFVDKMNKYLKKEQKKPMYPNNTVLTLPTNGAKAQILMRHNGNIFNVSQLTDSYYRYYEALMAFWLTQDNTSYSNPDYITYGKLIGGQLDETETSNTPNFQGNRYGNRLLFASIEINTTIVPTRMGHVEGLEVYDHWEAFMQEKMKKMPPSCRNGFQATPTAHNAWHWLKVQEVLASTAVRGILMSLGLAIGLLTLMTTNWIVGLMAGATIACITVGVVGFIPLVGWKLGVLESLNLTLVVGLAVDYVVHLADGYVRSHNHFRGDKTRDALGSVGISVLSGACTTLGASVFMLAAKIVFFFQFGIFMFCTIGLSISYALLFFTTLLALVGPNGNTGSMLPLWRYFRDMFAGTQEETEPEVLCERCRSRVPYKSPEKLMYGTATYTSAV